MPHRPFLYFVLVILLNGACAPQPSDEIPELPTFDQEYYRYALTSVEEVLAQQPNNAEAYYQRAKLLLQQERVNEALTDIEQAIDIDGHEPRYRLASAQALLRKGQNREAFREAEWVLKKSGPSAVVYETLAEASLRSNYFGEASQYSDNALMLSPSNYQNYYRKGKALARQGKAQAAEKNLLKSLTLGAEPTEAYGVLVDMYMEANNYQNARRYMDKILAASPAGNSIKFQQARILRMTGATDSAKVLLYQLKQDSTMEATLVLRELQDLHYQANYFDSALYYAQQVLAHQPHEKESMLAAARVYDRKRRYQQAIRQYEQIMALDSLQQENVHQEAVAELDKLRRKVAYLWRQKQQEEFEQLKQITPLPSLAPTGPGR